MPDKDICAFEGGSCIENLKERAHLENPELDGRLILKWA